MADPIVTPPAPASAPSAPAPSPAPAAAPAAAPSTLFSAAPAPAPSAAPAPAPGAPPNVDAPAWLPDKYRVFSADGTLDRDASGLKMSEGLAAAVKRIGTGDLPPETPADYKFTPPEKFKDVVFEEAALNGFRERAHKAGYTQAQYEFAMAEYFELVPSLLDASAAHTADQARGELQKVWETPADLNANMIAAERAVALAPPALRDQIKEKYGTDPLFWQFAAHYGKQLQEDRPPAVGGTVAPSLDVEALMKSPAYRDPKHPEHAAVSARVVEIQKRRYGEASVVG
jgi:hypothetical protein